MPNPCAWPLQQGHLTIQVGAFNSFRFSFGSLPVLHAAFWILHFPDRGTLQEIASLLVCGEKALNLCAQFLILIASLSQVSGSFGRVAPGCRTGEDLL